MARRDATPLQRVVIRDRAPIFGPDIYRRPLNCAALLGAGLSLAVLILGVVAGLDGVGRRFAWPVHVFYAVVGALWLFLGGLVFLQRRAGRAGPLFLFSAAAGALFLGLGTVYVANTAAAVGYAAGVLLFAPLLLSFVRGFDGRRPWHPYELGLYLPSLLLIWPSASGLVHNQVTPSWRAGLALIAVVLLAAIAQSIRDQAGTAPRQAAQTRALAAGLIAGTVPGTFLFVIPLALTSSLAYDTVWLPPLVLIFLAALGYATLLFEFGEADLIVHRGVVYGLLTLLVAAAYAGVALLLAATGNGIASVTGGLAFTAAALAVGAAFTSVLAAGRRAVDWMFYGGRADRWEMLQTLSERLVTVMEPDTLGATLVSDIVAALRLRGGTLLWREGDVFVARHRAGYPLRSLAPAVVAATVMDEALAAPPRPLLLVHARPLTQSAHRETPAPYRPLDALGAALSVPLLTRSGVQAVLCLEPKLAHDAFSAADLALLGPVVRQAAAALDNALLVAQLEDSLSALREAYGRIGGEQEAERVRLARELHDGTAQELAGLMTLAAVIERQMAPESPAQNTLARLVRQANDAYEGVRRASHALHPPLLTEFGLVSALMHYLEQFQEATGIRVRLVAETLPTLAQDVELALFRVIQECLENVRKHSGADAAEVTLRRDNEHIHLSVRDCGSGLEASHDLNAVSRTPGMGLAGMRERVTALGGTLVLDRGPEGGLSVGVTVPAEDRGQ